MSVSSLYSLNLNFSPLTNIRTNLNGPVSAQNQVRLVDVQELPFGTEHQVYPETADSDVQTAGKLKKAVKTLKICAHRRHLS